MARYDFSAIEEKWQRLWDAHGTYRVDNPGDPGFDASKPKFYVLDMFPYPSGDGLHVGHPIGYIGTDILARYKRMTGHNVLHPMGFDAFGLPAEQYAVETGTPPRETTEKNVANYERQLRAFGLSYDWSRTLSTTDPDYYRWTQWIFIQLFESWFDPDANAARPIAELIGALERGERSVDGRAWSELSASEQRDYIAGERLAYLDEVPVNWCPALGTVLANEEVTADGRSERGDHPVYRRPLRQWMLRITKYADRLIDDLDNIDWPESVKTMQRNWIGRSHGATIEFPIEGSGQRIEVFTTRPDTVFGATYMVLAPEHPLVDAITESEWPDDTKAPWRIADTPLAAIAGYRQAAARKSELERTEFRKKTGAFTGAYAINPLTEARIPIFVADYVLMGYGTGAIMAVPGQDERDWEFAEAFGLDIIRTVQPPDAFTGDAYVGQGPAINSTRADGFSLDGLGVEPAKEKIIEWLEANGFGEGTITYKLRDWLFSRQRYWGEPIPILHGPDGEMISVPAERLPVELPHIDDYRPRASNDENSDPTPALDRAPIEWKHVELDGTVYTRELNTMPQWAGSCWYYLRYIDNGNDERFVDSEAEAYWMGKNGVDLYVGGVEHAVLHLLYARFWHKVLYDLGEVSTAEPFGRLFNQGYVLAAAYQDERGFYVPAEDVEERDGAFFYEGKPVTQTFGKMGKSLKNGVSPDDVIAAHGVDTMRLYEMFMGPLDAEKPWTTRDIVGVSRFLQRLWRNFVDEDTAALRVTDDDPSPELLRLTHQTIATVTSDMEGMRFNTAVARLFELNNSLVGLDAIPVFTADAMVRLLAPFAPHVCEELWERMGHEGSVTAAAWPTWDPEMIVEEQVTMVVQVNGKVRDRIDVPASIGDDEAVAAALASERVQAHTRGVEPKKIIARPPKIVSIVV